MWETKTSKISLHNYFNLTQFYTYMTHKLSYFVISKYCFKNVNLKYLEIIKYSLNIWPNKSVMWSWNCLNDQKKKEKNGKWKIRKIDRKAEICSSWWRFTRNVRLLYTLLIWLKQNKKGNEILKYGFGVEVKEEKSLCFL